MLAGGNMSGKKFLFISVCLVLVASVFVCISVSSDHADGQDTNSLAANGQFDLAAALDNTEKGKITLTENTVLLRNACVKPEVTLDDGGFSLRIPQFSTLNIEGIFVCSGDITVDYGGFLTVASGGLLSIENDVTTANTTIMGSLEVYDGGTINVGADPAQSSQLACGNNGVLLVEGKMFVKNASYVNVRNAIITGELEISENSVFAISSSMIVGSAPTTLDDQFNSAKVTGKVVTGNTAYVIVYWQAGFDDTNMAPNSSLSTKFVVFELIYAIEYANKSKLGSKPLVFPVTSSLIDYSITGWTITHGKDKIPVSTDSNKQIGDPGYEVISGNLTKKQYTITFAKDDSIRWIVGTNNITIGSSGEESAAYGASYRVSVTSPSEATLPQIYKDGVQFTPGTLFKITGNTIFSTSNNYVEPGGEVPSLVIVLSIIIVILLIFLIVLYQKYREKTKNMTK